ncbi:helicase C-terminal domain-containing protein [uncultured Methanobrevibacter sp.]|uniref:helicase C-terminal domain-containing protein n=1 Tax=uncultured Methanobrevibacter sp. TaxID=253161 RepID=UPI0025E23E5B|nr:helicase C-terminal domain-containing protein [uncultured Methanobrevibacter sp.]
MIKWPYTNYSKTNGNILNYFPFEKPRAHQLEAISEILEAIERGYRYIVLEAGTGTGKSAIAATIARMFDTSYILTITKQLQDQYARDFPDFTVVKGRSNFRCRMSDCMCDEGKCIMESHICNYRLKDKVTRENTCEYYYQKYLGLNSDVVIANYPYMFLELNYVEDFTKRDLMICDEAHNIESMIMNQLKLEFTRSDLKEYIGFNLSKSRVNTLENGDCNTWISFIEDVTERFEGELEKIRHLERNTNVSRRILFMKNQISDCRRFISQISLHPNEWIFDYDRKLGIAQFKPLKADGYARDTLFRYGDVCVFMSATILDYELFAEWLGLEVDEIYPIRCRSPFDISRNPIMTCNRFNMTFDILKKTAPRTIKTIESILKRHESEKGIIHTISNQCRDFLMESINSERLITHDTTDRSQVLGQFKNSDMPLVLVSPSMNEGVDLPGDECRFQIIYKIPYPDLSDKQTQLRALENSRCLDYRTCLALVQTHGRGMRFSDDYCRTYVLDNRFMGYVYSDMISNQFLPDTFRNAIDRLSNQPIMSVTDSPEKLELIEKGDSYLENGDYDEAIRYFTGLKGNDLFADDYRIYLKLADALDGAFLFEAEIKVISDFFKSGIYCTSKELQHFRDRLMKLDRQGYFDYDSNIETLEKEFFKRALVN